MFLKSEVFEYGGQTITLSELSALQRIEHIRELAKLEQSSEGDESEAQKLTTALQVSIEISAQLVAMSLWQLSKDKPVADHQTEILESWSVEAIGGAANVVKKLSGMMPPEPEVQPGEDEPKTEPAEPITAEKSSPVS
ncbi:phage minor tail protein G [Lelliottia sp. V89_10]|uniref:phage tail assembly chaperone G n=1 Tax=Lelliottia wanjuensis TaxID=3050585 RepID=UPI00249F1122|nr:MULTISPECIES: phage minor tail protein G [unclassified Lelliottia]MDI3359777.1 phage minor tail protein G [Lelliottia sp. V89_13]MDK9548735.1 phage minor tail protein G [Lelliottia sp. V89_5]MDK9597367.1 phage minor tail protein G [Lelliottia sp. V89_10]